MHNAERGRIGGFGTIGHPGSACATAMPGAIAIRIYVTENDPGFRE
jgi:hypothetical protein